MPNRVTLALKINKALIAALWKSVKSFMTKCSDNKTSILPRAQKFSLDKGINGALLVEVFSIRTPPRQNTCRLHRTMNLGARRERIGSIRTSIQRSRGSTHAAAGERIAAGGGA